MDFVIGASYIQKVKSMISRNFKKFIRRESSHNFYVLLCTSLFIIYEDWFPLLQDVQNQPDLVTGWAMKETRRYYIVSHYVTQNYIGNPTRSHCVCSLPWCGTYSHGPVWIGYLGTFYCRTNIRSRSLLLLCESSCVSEIRRNILEFSVIS